MYLVRVWLPHLPRLPVRGDDGVNLFLPFQRATIMSVKGAKRSKITTCRYHALRRAELYSEAAKIDAVPAVRQWPQGRCRGVVERRVRVLSEEV